MTADVRRLVDAAEVAIGKRRHPEFESTATDLRILAALASYHSHRSLAGYHYALYRHARDLGALDRAIAAEKLAVAAWSGMVGAAGDAYAPNLAMGWCGADLCGHWRDELASLQQGLKKLVREKDKALQNLTQGELSIAPRPRPPPPSRGAAQHSGNRYWFQTI